MAEEQKFKRNVAFKLRIGDLALGKSVFDNGKFISLELENKKIIRVNVVGNIVEKYDSEGEKKFSVFTLDDGSGQIKIRAFGDDVAKFKEIPQGLTVVVIGVLRNFNNETYILPEIIKEQNPKYLLARKLELEKDRTLTAPPIEKSQIFAIRDKIMDSIKNSEMEGGLETDKIILNLREASPEIINQEIKKLLEDGVIFEPRPGKLRYLG